MNGGFYTLSSWYVREGNIAEFTRIWKEELAVAFRRYSASTVGTLIQNLDDPHQFYSFGPWESQEIMQQARVDPHVKTAIDKLTALCDEAKPGPYRVVLTVP